MRVKVRLYCFLFAGGAVILASGLFVLWRIHPEFYAVPCKLSSDPFQCFESKMSSIHNARGLEEAHRFLGALHMRGIINSGDCHLLAHKVGRAGFKEYGSVERALSLPGRLCNFGYFHGVLEGVFGDKVSHGMVAPDSVTELCQPFVMRWARAQCFHAIGHGLLYTMGYNLTHALNLCDSAGTQNEKESCYDGVFMENGWTLSSEFSGKNDFVKKRILYTPAAWLRRPTRTYVICDTFHISSYFIPSREIQRT